MYGTTFNALLVWSAMPWLYVAAQPTDEAGLTQRAADGLKLPHFYTHIDLDDFEKNGNDTAHHHDKRTDINACSYNRVDNYNICKRLSESQIQYLSSTVANQWYKSAHSGDKGDCGHHSGSSGLLAWDQFATNNDYNNQDCKTTAEKKTIAGALQKRLRSYSICGVVCVQMSHGGTWRGFLTLSANKDKFDPAKYSCSYQSANQCVTGGGDDCKGNCDNPK